MRVISTIVCYCLFLAVSGHAQSIVSSAPDSAQQGQMLTLTITGSNTLFFQESATAPVYTWLSDNVDSIGSASIQAINDTVVTAELTIPITATPGYWDVNAFDTVHGFMSLTNGCYIKPHDPAPAAPMLLAPIQGSLISDDNPFYDWDDPTYAVLYEIMLDDDPGFGSPDVIQSTTSYVTDWLTLADGQYYWKVRAKNLANLWSTWSATNSFTLTAVPRVVQADPDKAQPGEVFVMTITGESTHFFQESSTLTTYLSRGSDTIPMAPVTFQDNYTVEAAIQIPHNAAIGFWDLNTIDPTDGHLALFNGVEIYACDSSNCGFIEGNVFFDINQNCLFDVGEHVPLQFLLKLDPGPYISTDAYGHYSVIADVGTYTLSLIQTNAFWDVNCPATYSHSVTIGSGGQPVSNVDFGLEAEALCPKLTVNIGTNRLLRCNTNHYFVNYCNEGPIQEDDVKIELTFEGEVSPVSSTKNWSAVNGKTYTFDIGTLYPGQCGNFEVSTYVSCVNNMGRTYSTTARIFPDTQCLAIDPMWDQSSLAVSGACLGDSSLQFVIYNQGTGNMAANSQYRIYENTTLIQSTPFQLNAGDSLVIPFTGNGSTYRLEADQNMGHPGDSKPRVFVEACYPDTISWTLGQIATVVQDDGNDNIDIDPQVVVGSWDPNEKLVSPAGVLNKHYITKHDQLEYQINFQNTGTFMAFTVVIRDTLSEHLEIATVQDGASSHAYDFRIYGNGILEWTFHNINLPDSNTNEPESHGFVKFKVRQKANNAPQTTIDNKAAIVFDFNAPIVTNTVSNVVWEPSEQPTAIQGRTFDPMLNVTAYPNPFSHSATLLVKGPREQLQDLTLELYDLLGKQLQQHQVSSPRYQNDQVAFELVRGNLPEGILLYRLRNAQGELASGKLVVQ